MESRTLWVRPARAMRPNLRQLVPAVAFAALLLGLSSTADAGFIGVSDLTANDDLALGAGLCESGFDSGAGAATQPSDKKNAPTPDQDRLLRLIGLLPGMNAPGTTGSTTSAPTFGSGGHGGFTAIALTPTTPTAGQLELRLACQRDRYHPRFLKSRLFRPPRS